MKTKKLLSVILAAIMIISCFSITSFADTTEASTIIKIEAETGWTHNGIGVCERLGIADSNVIDSIGVRGNIGTDASGATYKVNITKAGKYSIKVFATSLYEQWTWVEVNGNKSATLASEVKTEGKNFATYGKKTEYMVVDLPIGTAYFTFKNGGTYNMFVDYYEFELLEAYHVVATKTLKATDATLGNNATVITEKTGSYVKLSKDTVNKVNADLSWTVNNLSSDGVYDFSVNHYISSGQRYIVYVNDVEVNTTDYFGNYNAWVEETIATDVPLKNGDVVKLVVDNTDVNLKSIKFTKTADVRVEAEIGGTHNGIGYYKLDNKSISVYKNVSGVCSAVTYKVNIPVSGDYVISVFAASKHSQYSHVKANGVKSGDISVNTGGDVLAKHGVKTEYLTTYLPAGEIEFTFDNGGGSSAMVVDYYCFELINKYTMELLKGNKSDLAPGAEIEWTVDIKENGAYDFILNKTNPVGIVLDVYVDGIFVKTTDWNATTQNQYEDFTILEDYVFNIGEHKIKLVSQERSLSTAKINTLKLLKIADVDTSVVTLAALKGKLDGNASWNNETKKEHAILYKGAKITWNVNSLFESGSYRFDAEHWIGCGERYLVYVNDELVNTTDWYKNTNVWVEETIAEDISLKNGDVITLLIDNQMVNVRKLTLTKTGEYVAPDPNQKLMNKLFEGGATIVVDTGDTWGDETEAVYAAVYYNGTLNKVYVENVNERTSVPINLEAINATTSEEKAKYTFRLFFWNDLTPVSQTYYPSYEIDDSTNIYVSQSGNDADNGSYARPVSTISRAQTLAQNAVDNGAENVIVHIEGGEYTLTSPLSFTGADNTTGVNVVYQGESDGTTVINGGKKVTGWTDDNKDGIYEARVDVTDLRQLWVNGKKAQRAQSGYMTGTTYGDNEGISISNLPTAVTDYENDLEIVWKRGWTLQRFNVDSITKEGNVSNLVLNRYAYALSETNSYIRPSAAYEFKIENAKFYLDEEGEFYFDKTYNILCYKPRSGESMENAECYIGVSEGFMNVNNANNITFRNLTFKHGTWLEPNTTGTYFIQDDLMLTQDRDGYTGGGRIKGQIEVTSSDNIHFDNVNLKNIGSAGYSFIKGVTNCTVKNSEIKGTSAGGVIIGSSDTSYRICDNVDIVNNKISDVAFEYGGQSAVKAYYVANTDITSNTIDNTSYSGISFGWGWSDGNAVVSGCNNNKITKNKISGYMKQLLDGGAIYTLGKSVSIFVKGNYINDTVARTGDTSLASGLYADDGSTGITFEKNVVENSNQWRHANTSVGCVTNINYNDNYYINSKETQKVNIGSFTVGEVTSTVYESGNISLTETDSNANAIINSAGAK